MAAIKLERLVSYCDDLLDHAGIEDYSGAVNGLQVENRGRVTRVAAAVDAGLSTVRMAVAAGADLLLVHHGLFWASRQPWTGRHFALLQILLENNLAVYSSHLPLDRHPKFGNNACLCAALGFRQTRPFFPLKNQTIGLRTRARISRRSLAERLAKILGGPPTVLPGGPETCRHIGVVTGGAGEELATAADLGIDTFITGEGPHWTYGLAEELGINVLYGGHYATETFGVRALARHLAEKFHLTWTFLDHPSGL